MPSNIFGQEVVSIQTKGVELVHGHIFAHARRVESQVKEARSCTRKRWFHSCNSHSAVAPLYAHKGTHCFWAYVQLPGCAFCHVYTKPRPLCCTKKYLSQQIAYKEKGVSHSTFNVDRNLSPRSEPLFLPRS